MPSVDPRESFLAGGGEMGARMRAFDWSQTPLGPPQTWPQSLRTAVSICLNCSFPITLFWGRRLTLLYNDAYTAILGSKHPALGADAVNVWREIWDTVAPMLRRVMDTGEATWSRDLLLPLQRSLRGTSEDCYFSFSYSPIIDEQGQVAGVFCPVIETTDTIRAQRLLEDEGGRLKTLFEHAPTFMAVLEGPNHVFTLVNGAYQRAVGPRPLLGLPVRAAFPEFEGQGFFELLDQAYRSGEAASLSGMRAMIRASHTGVDDERYVDAVYQPIRNADGSVRGIFVQGVDVTQRKRSERLDAFLVRLDDGTRTLADAEDIAETMMRLLCQELGADRASYFEVDAAAATATVIRDHAPGIVSLTGRTFTIDDFGSAFSAAMRGNHPLVLHDIADTPLSAGERARFDQLQIGAVIIFPLHKEGELIALVGVYQGGPRHWRPDEVERVQRVVNRCWEAIGRARIARALRDADQRKDEFIATLAHELRNPLAPLRNSLSVLRHGGADVPQERLFQMMERQVDHLVRLVDDLLDVSRITKGKIQISRDVVDLRQPLRTAVETSRVSIDSLRHVLEIQLPDEPVRVVGDAVRLTQIFSNLLNNAARYTGAGGRIAVRLERDGPRAVVRVSDNGIGIEASQQSQIFGIFAQGSEDRLGSGGGLGIGLYLVDRLVRLHGGRVSVHSAGRNQGSSFEVTLPLAAYAGTSAPTGEDPVPQVDEVIDVLVVDDNRDAADSIAMLLGTLGCRVEVAYDGAGALHALERLRPAIAFLDLGMPQMDGHELARRIRAREGGHDIALIALSGWGQEKDRMATRRTGFDEHLIKPPGLDAIRRVLLRWGRPQDA